MKLTKLELDTIVNKIYRMLNEEKNKIVDELVSKRSFEVSMSDITAIFDIIKKYPFMISNNVLNNCESEDQVYKYLESKLTIQYTNELRDKFKIPNPNQIREDIVIKTINTSWNVDALIKSIVKSYLPQSK
jgi:hypothetical protein